MRRFVVMNPNLSVGRQGDVVTADQLKMTDDQLDQWVGAGHGIEVVTATAEPNPPVISFSTPSEDDEDYDDEET